MLKCGNCDKLVEPETRYAFGNKIELVCPECRTQMGSVKPPKKTKARAKS